jgi:hypothetical protein
MGIPPPPPLPIKETGVPTPGVLGRVDPSVCDIEPAFVNPGPPPNGLLALTEFILEMSAISPLLPPPVAEPDNAVDNFATPAVVESTEPLALFKALSTLATAPAVLSMFAPASAPAMLTPWSPLDT